MAKGNIVKPPVNDAIHVETNIVIDDDESNPVLPMDDRNVGPESTSNPVEDGSPVFDKDVQPDPVINLPSKEKHVETIPSGFHDVGGMIHPLFVNCLLDKIRRMEERVNEVIANRDLMEVDNRKLKEKVDSSDKHLLRLK